MIDIEAIYDDTYWACTFYWPFVDNMLSWEW